MTDPRKHSPRVKEIPDGGKQGDPSQLFVGKRSQSPASTSIYAPWPVPRDPRTKRLNYIN